MAFSLSKYIGYACKLLLCLSMFCFVDEQKHFYRQFISFLPYFQKFLQKFQYTSVPGCHKKGPGLPVPEKFRFPRAKAGAYQNGAAIMVRPLWCGHYGVGILWCWFFMARDNMVRWCQEFFCSLKFLVALIRAVL